MSARKVQLTVRVEAEVVRAAKERAGHMKMSVSAAIAEAAKESLLSSYRSERETEILKAVERNFQVLRGFERRVEFELRVMKEMLGLGMRSFFNHTPAVPEPDKSAALLSGKIRFGRYLDLLARNLHAGDSVLGEVPHQGTAELVDGTAPSKEKQNGKAAHATAGNGEIVGSSKGDIPLERSNWGLFDSPGFTPPEDSVKRPQRANGR